MTHKKTYNTKRILTVLGVVCVLAYAFVIQGQGGFTFATNTGTGQPPLELTIDSTTYYNNTLQPALTWDLKNLVPGVDRFWNFDDVKPGDTGTSSISLHIKNGPAYICLDFYNYKDFENGINEPESHVDTSSTTGELGPGLEFFAWRDDGDKKFEVGEKPLFGTSTQSAVKVLNNTTYAIADALTGNPIQDWSTQYVGVYWCAGDLEVDLATAQVTCNGKVLGNEAQTDSMMVDVGIRAVSAKAQPKFTCTGTPPPVNWCEIEGHKYDKNGKPLKDWLIGLSKKIRHNNGFDMYDLATTTTDSNGYFCLDWNGESRTLRGVSTYKGGAYTHEYFVYEYLKQGWENAFNEKGPNPYALLPVLPSEIWKDGSYINITMGSGYIIANAGYHVDFYNATVTQSLAKKKKGNNGHGNDADENDNSNPGKSNDLNDDTDDDGLPPGFSKKHESGVVSEWQKVEKKGVVTKLIEKGKSLFKRS